MKQNKAFQLLRTLTTWELRSLDDYLRSPFFHKQRVVLELWSLVRPLAPDFEDNLLARRRLFEALWPDKDYRENKLRYLLTDFTRLIEGFLAYKQWRGNEHRYQLDLIRAYEARGLRKYFEQKSQRLHESLQQNEFASAVQLHQHYELEETRYLASQDKGQDSYPVQAVLLSLDRMAIAHHLKYACEGVNRARIFSENWQPSLTPYLLQALDNNPSLGSELAYYYRLVFSMLTESDHQSHYRQFKEKLLQDQVLQREEIVPLYFFALNHCIRQVNAGQENFRQESFELYRRALTNDFLNEGNGFLAESHFKNLVALGTRLGEYDWTLQFIENYQSQLDPSIAENAFRYNLAYLLFAQQDYRRVLQLLRQVEFTNVFYQLGAKTILIRTYYETEEYEALLYLLKSFRSYLQRQKSLSAAQRSLYLNLCHMVRLLTRYHLGERVSLKQIQEAWEKRTQAAAGPWLQEKIEDLKSD